MSGPEALAELKRVHGLALELAQLDLGSFKAESDAETIAELRSLLDDIRTRP